MPAIESILGGTRNEIVERVPWDDYKQSPGLNPSTIVQAVRGRHEDGELVLSMRRLKWAWEHSGQKDSDDLLWGRAVHCLLFEPKEFERRYAAWEEGRPRRGKDYDAFRLDNWGKEILSAAQWESALTAAQAFVGEPLVQELIAEGQAEVTVFKTVHGLQCRGRMDWLRSPRLGRRIVDLKTTKSIAPRPFGFDFYRYHYDIKLGLYRRWVSEVTRCHWPVTVIAMEKDSDNDIAVIPVPDAVLDFGAEKGLKICRRVKECLETGCWPGIAGGEEFYLHVPHSEMESVDELEGATEVTAA